jgi:transposase
MGSYIGIDISKHHLDIAIGDQMTQIKNDQSSIRQWISQVIQDHESIDLIVCEPTGGYERLLVRELQHDQLPVVIEHANKIRAFAKSQGQLAKTDRVDAQMIARYAALIQPQPKQIPLAESTESIRALLKRREQLVDMRAQEQTRLDKQLPNDIQTFIQEHIDYLNEQIKQVDQKIKDERQTSHVNPQVELLCSIPAIGTQTALMVLAYLPEIAESTPKQLASLVGVAPFNRDSGQYRGKRFIQGGRQALRKSLYMAAVAAIKWNQPLADFYQRLVNRGKSAKVALVAVMNKMLRMIRSVYQRGTPWIDYQQNA